MKTYTVKYTVTFIGYVEVRAENKERAKHIIEKGFGIGYLSGHSSSWDSHDKDDEGIVDWNFDMKGKPKIK